MPAIPLSLYIHTPWCIKKCPYCDFNSHQKPTILPEREYINRLIEEAEEKSDFLKNRQINTIFIGGGTPSLFEAHHYQRLFSALREIFNIATEAEITLEANPGTVEQKRFEGYLAAGINRLSLGIQSFDDKKLKALGRIHGGEEAQKAVLAAQQAGFTNINLDLMHALPQQSLEEGLKDLIIAISFNPLHISWYQLTVEPNTYFHQFPPILPQDDLIWTLQDQGQTLLREQGYEQYEVSAYAKPGKQCQHNLNYWEFGDYLGLGAGAHSKITHPNSHQIVRSWNAKNPKSYLSEKLSEITHQKMLTLEEIPLEFALNAFRLQKPLSLTLWKERTGLSLDRIAAPLEVAIQKQWIILEKENLILTKLGRDFLNDVLELFLVKS